MVSIDEKLSIVIIVNQPENADSKDRVGPSDSKGEWGCHEMPSFNSRGHAEHKIIARS